MKAKPDTLKATQERVSALIRHNRVQGLQIDKHNRQIAALVQEAANRDSHISTMARHLIELEEKLGGRIRELEQRMSNMGDRLDAMIASIVRKVDELEGKGDAAKFMEIAAKLPSGEQVERNLELRRTIRCLMDSLTVALGKLS